MLLRSLSWGLLSLLLSLTLLNCGESRDVYYDVESIEHKEGQPSYKNLGLEKDISESLSEELLSQSKLTYKEAKADLESRQGEGETYFIDENSKYGNARFISTKISYKDYLGHKPSDEKEAAAAFLSTYRALFGIKNPQKELRLKSVTRDYLNSSHLKYDQYYQGIPVFGAQLIVHLDKEMNVTAANGQFVTDVAVSTKPKLSKSEALRLTSELINEKSILVQKNDLPEIDLSLFDKSLLEDSLPSQARLVWKLSQFYHEFFIDAHTGALIFSYSHKSHERRIKTYDVGGENHDYAARFLCIDENENRINQGVCSEDIQRLHEFTQETYDYFLRFGRDSYDDRGSVIHVVGNHQDPIAASIGRSGHLRFPSGYGSENVKDIVAHEYTHQIINWTSGLIYFGQSGALNESFADFFGAMVDFDGNYWEIRENAPDVSLINRSDRDMSFPNLRNTLPPFERLYNSDPQSCSFSDGQPEHMDEYCVCPTINGQVKDAGCIHVNSGIPNRAAYLIIERLGKSDAEKVYYRALSDYLTPTDNFYSGRSAIYSACLDLVSEVRSIAIDDCFYIREAFETVGIGTREILKPGIYPSRSIFAYQGEIPGFEVSLPPGHSYYVVEVTNDPRLFASPNDLNERGISRNQNGLNFISSYDTNNNQFLNINNNGNTYRIPEAQWNQFRRNLWKDWTGQDLENVENTRGFILSAFNRGGKIYYRVISSSRRDSFEGALYSSPDLVLGPRIVSQPFGAFNIPSVSIAKWHSPGTLIKRESFGAIYYLDENDEARWICDEDSFRDHGFDFDKVITISDEELSVYRGENCNLNCIANNNSCDSLPRNCHASCPPHYPRFNNYSLYKERNFSTIWINRADENFLCPISSEEAYKSWGYSTLDIDPRDGVWDGVDHPALDNVEAHTGLVKARDQNACPVPIRDGTLIADRNSPDDIYVVYNGRRYLISNDDLYQAMYSDPDHSFVIYGRIDGTTVPSNIEYNYSLVEFNRVAEINININPDDQPGAGVRDFTEPEGSLNQIDDVLSGGQDFEIRWMVSDNIAVMSSFLYYSTDNWNSFARVSFDNLSPGPISQDEGSLTWRVPRIDSENVSIRLVVTDQAENTSTFYSNTFTIQSRAPEPERYRIYGYVTDQDGRDLQDAKVNVYGVTDGRYYGRQFTDENGYYERNSLPEGTYRIRATKRGYSVDPFETFIHIDRDVREDFRATLETFEIDGIITLANENPVSNIRVRAVSQEGGNSYSTSTDEEGRFVFHLPPGVFRIIPQDADYLISPLYSDEEIRFSHFGLGPVEFIASSRDSAFAEVTLQAGIGDNSALSHAIAVGDYNNDGYDDIYVVNSSENEDPNQLFRNNGGNGFTEVATEAGVADLAFGFGAVWADYNGDGWLDLYVTNDANSPNRLYRNNQNGTFTDVAAAPDFNLDYPFEEAWGAAFGDYDSDGDLDLFINFASIPDKLFRNDNAQAFVDVSLASGIDPALSGGGGAAAWIDFDLDGDLDLIAGDSELFINQGDGRFESHGLGLSVGQGLSWGDYNNDLYPDLFKGANNQGNPDEVLRNNFNFPLDPFIDVTDDLFDQDYSGRTGTWVDYDNDGWVDLHSGGGLLRNNGDETFTDKAQEEGLIPCEYACIWFDYDHDGILDVFMGRLNQNSLFKGQNQNQNLLAVKLQGQGMNRFGVGSRVIVTTADGHHQSKQVVNGTSLADSASPTLYFGLGAFEEAESIRVIWPNGVEDEIYDIANDQPVQIVQAENQDDIPPAPVEDLLVSNKDTRSITLSWTAPGDDGHVRRATRYDIRYNLSPITEDNWDSSISVDNPPRPLDPGELQEVIVENLQRNTLYYFALKTIDEMGNESDISNNVSDRLAFGRAIYNLAAGRVTESTIALQWTAPDIPEGSYLIGLSQNIIQENNWENTQQIRLDIELGSRGDRINYELENLNSGTSYYIVVRIETDEGLTPLSNMIQVNTQVSAVNSLEQAADSIKIGSLYNRATTVHFLGKFNDDDFDDFAVLNDERDIYIYYGGPQVDIQEDLIFAEADGNYATTFDAIGDINNDGYDDLIIADPYTNDGGKARLHFGNQERDSLVLNRPQESSFGRYVGSLGDLNQDEIEDFFIGSSSTNTISIFLGGVDFDQNQPDTISWPEGDYRFSDTGDINGDGDLDFIFGTERIVHVYYGDNRSLPQEPSLSIEFGESLSYYGKLADLDNDGDDEVIFGSYSQDRVYLFWGGDELSPEADLIITNDENDNLGRSLTVGDLNNDGIEDLILGRPNYLNGNGRVDVFLGSEIFDTNSDFSLYGINEYGSFLDAGGDVNGDSIPDLLIGSDREVFIYLGNEALQQRDDLISPNPVESPEIINNGLNEVILTWVSPGEDALEGIASFYDLRYLSYDWRNNLSHWPKAIQVNNEPAPLEAGYVQSYRAGEDQFVPGLDYTFGLQVADEWLNFSDLSDLVTGRILGSTQIELSLLIDDIVENFRPDQAIGNFDFDGDGHQDFLISYGNYDHQGVPSVGVLHLFLGEGEIGSEIIRTDFGDDRSATFGEHIVGGDFDGDNFDDFVAFYEEGVGNGQSRVYFGNDPMDLVHDETIVTAGRYFIAGDLNGDNADDFILIRGSNEAGQISIFQGGPNFGQSNIPNNEIRFQNGDELASDSKPVTGDFNNDGFDDLVVSKRINSDSADREVIVYFGNNPFDENQPGLPIRGINGGGSTFGDSLANAGDLNGDGIDDLAIANPDSDYFYSSSGIVYIYFGGEGFDENPDLFILPPPYFTSTELGKNMASLGDINNDGYDDLGITGINRHNNFSQILFILLGGDPLDSNLDSSIDAQNSEFASQIVELGDLDHDGLSDFLTAHREDARIFSFNPNPVLPLADAGPDQFVQRAAEVQLDGAGESENGNVSYQWLQISGYKVELDDSSLPNPSFIAPDIAGTLSFVLVVRDDNYPSIVDQVDIQVVADSDGDGFSDVEDNCPQIANPNQINSDRDNQGDLCDADDDNDGVLDEDDACPLDRNDNIGDPCNHDEDGDGVLDIVDLCPFVVNDNIGNPCNPNDCPDGSAQDEIGDLCNHDEDGDGVDDNEDDCPFLANDNVGDVCNPNDCDDGSLEDNFGEACNHDDDGDTILDFDDNCPFISNLNQSNLDGDSFGDECDEDIDGDGILNEIDRCPSTELEAIVDNHGCSQDQSLCDSFADLVDHPYREEICFLIDQGHWFIELGQDSFGPDEDMTLIEEVDVLLSVGDLLEEASIFDGGLCPWEPHLSYAIEERLLSIDQCLDLRLRRRLNDLLISSSNVYLNNADNLVYWEQSYDSYQAPNLEETAFEEVDFESLVNPYGIDRDLFKVSYQRQALPDFNEGLLNPEDDAYARRILSRGEAAYIIYWMLGLSGDDDRDGLLDEEDPCPWRFSPGGNCEIFEDPGFFTDILLLREIIRAFSELIDVSNPDVMAEQFPNYRFEDFDLTGDGFFNANDVDLAIAAFLNDPYDNDGDGLLGFYELRCRYAGENLVLDPRNSQTYEGQDDGDLDCDGDGVSNLQEFEEGRDPLDGMN